MCRPKQNILRIIMSQPILTISRDAGNTSKGYTLQKLRTITLLLDELAQGEEVDFVAAIEYFGDVYIANDYFSYVEENKDYDSQNFSFASSPIKNTMVYFLDHWLNNDRDAKIRFGVFATNAIVKETNRGAVKDLNIALPETKIIESLQKQDYADARTLAAAKVLILDEYKSQYENNSAVKLDQSHYAAINSFTDKDWKDFFGSITWTFTNTSLEDLEAEIIGKINATTIIPSTLVTYKAPFIRAELFYQLELRQAKSKTSERFLKRAEVENIFLKAISGQINEGSYKYLKIDYDQIKDKTKQFLTELLNLKYFAISGIRKPPGILQRDVLLFDENIKLDAAYANNYNRLKQDAVKGTFSNLVQSNKPIFLFGELGSGKSSIVAQYLLDQIGLQPEIVPVFVPSAYLHQKKITTLAELKAAVNSFVNEELQVEDHVFDLDILFKTKKEAVLVIDGIDELDLKMARQVITHLKTLKQGNDFLRIIATGRPVELEGVVPAGWHTLSIVPLTDKDIVNILLTEAVNRDVPQELSIKDSQDRLMFLKMRPELLAISTTPLIICSIRDSLDANITDKTLGDILYDAVKHKLSWNNIDSKSDEYNAYADAYPTAFSREPLLAALAWEIFSSENKALNEAEIHTIIASLLPESPDKPKITAQAAKFFKNNFLQMATGGNYAFISAPILECAVGIFLSEKLKTDNYSSDFAQQWRSLSFALAIARQKGISDAIEPAVLSLVKSNLSWPNNFVSQTAILLAEYKSERLCDYYFDTLNTLQFRPLRVENNNDIISKNAYALCMILAKAKGFKWFWENYLDLRNPLVHYEGKLAADILTQFLVLQNFQIDSGKQQQLESLIQPNMAFPGSFCFELLPVIATITEHGLSVKERYQLLASNLSNTGLKERSKSILIQEARTTKDAVLDALETICNFRDDKAVEPAELWMELNSERKISKAIMETILKGVTVENFQEYKFMLTTFVKDKDLHAFLSFSVLSDNTLSQSAALFLFMEGERNFKLIGSSLLKSIDWLDSKNYEMVGQIVEFVRGQDIQTITSIINKLPVDNHLGIPPAFWRVLLHALEQSQEIYQNQFTRALGHMSLYTLTRYPEIRLAFSNLLKSKIQYLEAAHTAMVGLDTQLRYLSASLLLTVNPGEHYDALEIVINGMRNGSDMDEWETFCLGLHYSPEILEVLHSKIESFNGMGKTYALLLLSRNQKKIDPAQREELISGLLSEAYFVDKQGSGFELRYHVTLSQPEYKGDLMTYLNGTNLARAERAADILFHHHMTAVDEGNKPKIIMLHSEQYDRNFFDFTEGGTMDLSEGRFVSQLEIDAHLYKQISGNEPLLWLYCRVLKTRSGLDILVKRLIQKAGDFMRQEWNTLYTWFINIGRRFPDLKPEISNAVHELLLIPALAESEADSFGWLKLMENEFDLGSDVHSDTLQKMFPRTEEELFIALYIRDVYRVDIASVQGQRPMYYAVFANRKSTYIEEVSQCDLERFLFDIEDIPYALEQKIENVLLFGNLTPDELAELESKGDLARYFGTVVKFCRQEPVDTKLFPTISDIGGYSISQRSLTEFHRNILFHIYKILLTEEQYNHEFIAGLVTHLEDENDENFVKHFQQLLSSGFNFTREKVFKFFDAINGKPYLLKERLAANISHYLANEVTDSERDYYVEYFKKLLRINRSQYSKYASDPQRHTISWILSLAVLYFEGAVSDESKFGFLLGLQNCFLEKESLQRNLINKPDHYFEAGSLLKSSEALLAKVEPGLIREICTYGLGTNIPEVRAVCYVLTALARGLK